MISVKDLVKVFAGSKGEVRALRGVSFDVAKG
jgi:ABC-type glutathione transport system ATPase component